MPNETRELSITNETKNLSLARTVVSELIDMSPFPSKQKNQIILAVDEAIANVIEHAYQDGRGQIDLLFKIDEEKLEIHIRDNGVRFRPDMNKAAPDIKEHIRLGLDGGLGMFLMRRVMDEVRYFSTEKYTNELAMTKFFAKTTEGEG